MRHAMIMAGGAGTRLWPLSRHDLPKQLAPLIGGRSLLEVSAGRLEGLIPPERRWICTNEAHRAPIRKRLPQFSDERILGEPVGRDTVNAVGFAAAIIEKSDPGAVMAVYTADHLIEPEPRFRELSDLAMRLVEDDPRRLVTFSIKPTFATSQYGYIEQGEPIDSGGERVAFKVAHFVEKPDMPTAVRYVATGRYAWNSGMFFWRASTFLEALRAFKPDSYAGIARIAEAWGTGAQQSVLDEVYPTLPKTSVDYAVMEPASKDERFTVCTVVADLDWRDVGSWPSLADTLEPDADGNRTTGSGGAVLHGVTGSLVMNTQPDHVVAVLGASDLVVVHTADATLVMPRAEADRIKDLHAGLPERLR